MKELEQRVEYFEQIIEKLEQKIATKNNTSSAEANVTDTNKQTPSFKVVSTSKKDWQKGLSNEHLEEVKRLWPEILVKVKEERITVHAWLIAGEPVAATADMIIIAFKSEIHRQTTEKEPNKEIIQQVIKKIMGTPQSLRTLMWNEWLEIQSSITEKKQIPQIVTKKESPEKDIVKKAVELFGEDLVEVKD
jgi:DNA polymerase-3 subunit gamma/tau